MSSSFVVLRGLLSCLLGVLAFFVGVAQAQVPAPLPIPRLSLAVAGEVRSVAEQANGGLILIGSFTSIDGMPRDGIARLRADGSLDPLWYPRVRWTNKTSIYQRVHALPDGSVLMFGNFDRINGQPSFGCGEKLSADPSPVVVASWRANASCVSGEIAFDDQGWLYFQGLGYVRRLRADTGEHDPNWFYSYFGSRLIFDGNGGLILEDASLISRISLATGNLIWQIPSSVWGHVFDGGAYPGDAEIYLANTAGHIDKLSLTTGASAAGWPKAISHELRRFALGADGTLYVGGIGWAKALSGANGEMLASWTFRGVRREVLEFERRGDGRMVVAGNFAQAGDTPALGLAELVSSTNTPVEVAAVEDRGFAERVVRQPDGHVIVSGTFDQVNGVQRHRLLRLTPDGALDANWAPRVDEWIRQMTVDSQGDLYLVGNFRYVDDHYLGIGLAKINGDSGSVVSGWRPDFDGEIPTALVVDAADRVYVSMFHTSSQLAYRLQSDGSVDAGWTPTAPVKRTQGLQRISRHIYAIGIDAQDHHVVRRMSVATGTVDPDWQLELAPLWDSSAIGIEWALAQFPDGDLLVGGGFDTLNGVPRRRLARVSATAPAVVRDWNPAPNSNVSAFGATTTGRLFVGGAFTTIGGTVRYGVAEMNPADGAVLDRWIAPSGGGRMAVADDRIYFVAGSRGVTAYPLDIGDTIFATHFD